MKKFLISIVTLAIAMLPAAANAEQCRDSATGKFAKCGAPGAVPASQYVAKTKMAAKPMHAKAKTMPMPMAAKATPMPAATKAARCKTSKGKFIKCGMPGAMPA